MARAVASRISPRTGMLRTDDATSKAARKNDKKVARNDRSRLLGKIFAGAVGALLLPAFLLVLRNSILNARAHSSRTNVAELSATLRRLQTSLQEEKHRDSPVVALSGSVVDFVVKYPDGALVEFYMPDCEHCKKLFPEYEAAAKELAVSGGPPLASLNGEAYPEVAEQHGVSRYPTVLWFRQGEAVQELRPTSRTKEKILEFVEWVQQPAFTEFETNAEFDEAVPHLRQALQEKSPPVVVGFARADGDAVQDTLGRVAERFRGKVLFLYVKEPSADDVAPFRSFSASVDNDSSFTGVISRKSLQQWMESLLPGKSEAREPGLASA